MEQFNFSTESLPEPKFRIGERFWLHLDGETKEWEIAGLEPAHDSNPEKLVLYSTKLDRHTHKQKRFELTSDELELLLQQKSRPRRPAA